MKFDIDTHWSVIRDTENTLIPTSYILRYETDQMDYDHPTSGAIVVDSRADLLDEINSLLVNHIQKVKSQL